MADLWEQTYLSFVHTTFIIVYSPYFSMWLQVYVCVCLCMFYFLFIFFIFPSVFCRIDFVSESNDDDDADE